MPSPFPLNTLLHDEDEPDTTCRKPFLDKSIDNSQEDNQLFGDNNITAEASAMGVSNAWLEDFSHRPSWCDASMALEQVQRGNAKGLRPALVVRKYLQAVLFKWGKIISRHYAIILAIHIVLFAAFIIGLRKISIITDINKLWVDHNGPLHSELEFVKSIREDQKTDAKETGSSGGASSFPLILIQTPMEGHGNNILNRADLLAHHEMLVNISRMQITHLGANWTLTDFCFKPGAPEIKGELGKLVNKFIKDIIPCAIISPLDCFWEGAFHLGPNPPIKLGFVAELIDSIPSEASWLNINPEAIMNEAIEWVDLAIEEALNDVKEYQRLFERAGILSGYITKPCLNPSHPMCPSTAPNSPRNNKSVELSFAEIFNAGCSGVAEKLMRWPDELILGGIHRSSPDSPPTKAEALESLFLVESSFSVYQRFAKGGKAGLAQSQWDETVANDVLQMWQRNFSNMVYNSDFNRDPNLRSQFVSTYTDRFYPIDLTSLPVKNYSQYIYPPQTFDQQSFLRREYTTAPMFHPLVETSMEDMMKEFSKFDPTVLSIGYVLMLLYAFFMLVSFRGRAIESCGGLAIAGVLLVTFASVAGLGCATVAGIDFNAATTNIVPFLTLGLGVDDMFLLVHNYIETIGLVDQDELGYLLKETGLSVLLTSISNILAFACGGLLPVPALQAFCWQVAITLLFNVVAILTMYPAIMQIDLIRRRSRRSDIFCCFQAKDKISPQSVKSSDHRPPSYDQVINGAASLNGQSDSEKSTPVHVSGKNHTMVTSDPKDGACSDFLSCEHILQVFVQKYYHPFLSLWPVKAVVVLSFVVLAGLGILGLTAITPGLELTDVVPRGTAPYDFLDARERYFSFYLMNAVTMDEFDYATGQDTIHAFRRDLINIDYMVKGQGSLGQTYWLALMRDWAIGLQNEFEKEWKKGRFTADGPKCDGKTFLPSNAAVLAWKLLVNVDGGTRIDRSMVNRTRLVDRFGRVNPDKFYTALTAWTKADSMMYYFSLASLYPEPRPTYSYSKGENCRNITQEEMLIPAAEPLKYAQIPFFMVRLTDTVAIVDMTRKVRGVSEHYTEAGLPNFPEGIPFTFWDQYLTLWPNLVKALAITVVCVCLAISILLVSPWTGAIVTLVLIMMVVELGGFMGLIGLKMNPVSAVTLITAVGIGVEFTVHLSLSYLTCLGTPNVRMGRTLDHMFQPVIHGGLSTLLGIVMLAFAEFEFVVRYFFFVMTALVILGLFNGLVLLPVLLSLIGPRPEVRPVDGSDTLPPPSPRSSSPSPPVDSSPLATFNNNRSDAPPSALSTITEEGSTPRSHSAATSVQASVQKLMRAISVDGGGCGKAEAIVCADVRVRLHTKSVDAIVHPAFASAHAAPLIISPSPPPYTPLGDQSPSHHLARWTLRRSSITAGSHTIYSALLEDEATGNVSS